MRYFNPNRKMQRFKDWQADCMARERGIKPHRREGLTPEQKQALIELALHSTCPIVRHETKVAYGSIEKRKGGIIKGARAF